MVGKGLGFYRLRIVDYFEVLVNQVDLKAELAICESLVEGKAVYEERVKNIRQSLVDSIKACEENVLRHFNDLNTSQLTRLDSHGHENLDAQLFGDEFCFFIERTVNHEATFRDFLLNAFPCLLIINTYLNPKQLSFFRNFLEYCHSGHCNENEPIFMFFNYVFTFHSIFLIPNP